MPIQGLSDVRRYPRDGKVRLGVKQISPKTGNEYPKAVDYFVVNADDSTSEAAAAAFHSVYGDKPRTLRIVIPVPGRDLYFPQWYKAYGASRGKICQGDGVMATRSFPETGEMLEMPCNPDECELYDKKHCRRIGSLSFLMPDVPGLGIWVIETTSWNSIVNINSSLDMIERVAGRVHMLPLLLTVQPHETIVEGQKKIVYVLQVRPDAATVGALWQLGQIPPGKLPLLPMPAADDSKPPDDLFPKSIVEAAAAARGEQAPVAEPAPAPTLVQPAATPAPAAPEKPVAPAAPTAAPRTAQRAPARAPAATVTQPGKPAAVVAEAPPHPAEAPTGTNGVSSPAGAQRRFF